ncbi:phosphoglucosamine mutase, partial [Mammaliicoccus sciuri]
AHGSTYSLAPYLFGDLEATSETIGCKPDGYNINLNVGSTHPEELAKAVIEHGADLGLAFDGDGDRIIAVDDKGQIVDSDQIVYVLAEEMSQNGELQANMV